jgi:hypothetical protein
MRCAIAGLCKIVGKLDKPIQAHLVEFWLSSYANKSSATLHVVQRLHQQAQSIVATLPHNAAHHLHQKEQFCTQVIHWKPPPVSVAGMAYLDGNRLQVLASRFEA